MFRYGSPTAFVIASFACLAFPLAGQGGQEQRDLGVALHDAVQALPPTLRSSAVNFLNYDSLDSLKETASMAADIGNGLEAKASAWDGDVSLNPFLERAGLKAPPNTAVREIGKLMMALGPFLSMPENKSLFAQFGEAYGIAKGRIPSLSEEQLRHEVRAFLKDNGIEVAGQSGKMLNAPTMDEAASPVLAEGVLQPDGTYSLDALRKARLARLKPADEHDEVEGPRRPRYETRIWGSTRFIDIGNGRMAEQRLMQGEVRAPIKLAQYLGERPENVSQITPLSDDEVKGYLAHLPNEELSVRQAKYVLLNAAAQGPVVNKDKRTTLILGPNFTAKDGIYSFGPVILAGSRVSGPVVSEVAIFVDKGSEINGTLQAPLVRVEVSTQPGAAAEILSTDYHRFDPLKIPNPLADLRAP